VTIRADGHIYSAMLRPAPYLSQKLDRPLPTKDGGTLRTVAEARAYMLGLSKARELNTRWQRAAELLLAEAAVAELSRQVELALFMEAKLILHVSTDPKARKSKPTLGRVE
jgi:hypothetical protein